MSSIVLLFAVGLILLGFEVFVPGAILGIFGGLALLGGTVVAFLNYGTSGGLIALVVALLLVGLLLYVEIRVLPQTSLGRRLFLRASVTGENHAVVAPTDVIGQSGTATTTLAPTGYVIVGGQRYESYSQSGYIPAGTTVRVVGRDNFRLIVTQA